MEGNNSIHIAFEDLFKLIMGLISDDLKVQKHFHNLSLSGLDTIPLQLNLPDAIFQLIGFRKNTISEELRQWYFQQTERVFEITHDEESFQSLVTEILEGLITFRNQAYAMKIKSS